MHLLADYIAHCSKNTDSVLKDLKDSLLVHLTIVGLSYSPLVHQGTGDMADVKGYLMRHRQHVKVMKKKHLFTYSLLLAPTASAPLSCFTLCYCF